MDAVYHFKAECRHDFPKWPVRYYPKARDTGHGGLPRRGSAVDLDKKWEGILDSFLLSYSQVLFSRDRWVGLLILAATSVRLDLFFFGLIAVFLTNGFALSLHLSKSAIEKGMFGYNGLLIGLAFPSLFKINVPLIVIFVM